MLVVKQIGAEFLAAPRATGQQRAPAVAAYRDGFVIGYIEESLPDGDGSGSAVMGQLFDAQGVRIGGAFSVASQTRNSQSDLTFAPLASGGFTAVWTSNIDIHGQVFDTNGAALGPEFVVNVGTQDQLIEPVAAGLPDGGFVVVWQDLGGDGDAWAVNAQLFDPSGAKRGTQFLVNTQIADSQARPSSAPLLSGNFMIVWEDSSHLGGDSSGSAIKG